MDLGMLLGLFIWHGKKRSWCGSLLLVHSKLLFSWLAGLGFFKNVIVNGGIWFIYRHLYEQDMLLAEADVSVREFDENLRVLRGERVRVQVVAFYCIDACVRWYITYTIYCVILGEECTPRVAPVSAASWDERAGPLRGARGSVGRAGL